jgi:hypothetical protein
VACPRSLDLAALGNAGLDHFQKAGVAGLTLDRLVALLQVGQGFAPAAKQAAGAKAPQKPLR